LAKAIPAWAGGHLDCSAVWARSLQMETKLWLRARRGGSEKLLKKLRSARRGPLPESILYEGEDDLFRTPEFHAGDFEIQDINSQAVSLICDPEPGETWWDACAGEVESCCTCPN